MAHRPRWLDYADETPPRREQFLMFRPAPFLFRFLGIASRSDTRRHAYFVGPLPVQFGGLVALMRRASFTSSFTAPVTGSESPALSVISATTCMSLSAQVKEIMSHSLSASELPELIISASRSLTRSMPVVSASRPASISPTALIQSSRLFMVLPTWPCPTWPRCA